MHWLLGYPDRASVALRHAVGLAERLAHPLSLVFTFTAAAFVQDQMGQHDAARASAERAAAIAEGHEFAAGADDSAILLACLAARESGDGRPLAELYQRITAASAPFAVRQVLNLCLLASTFVDIGDVERGFEVLSALPQEHREVVYAAEIRRIEGEGLKRRGDRVRAEGSFRRAIEIAHRRGERSLELRAAFTEGLATPSLREARRALDDLS